MPKTLKEVIQWWIDRKEIPFDKLDYGLLAMRVDELQEFLKTVPQKPEDKEVELDDEGKPKIPEVDWSKVEIPEEIIKKFAEPLLDTARKEEKKILYDTIAGLKDGNTKLVTDLEARQKAEEDIKKVQIEKEELEKLEKMKAKDAILELEKKYKHLFEKQTNSFQTEISKVRDEAKVETLRLHRDSLLKVGGEDVIPEMILGNTIEELDNSYELSSKKVKDIREATTGSLKEEQDKVDAKRKEELELEESGRSNRRSPFFTPQEVIEPDHTGSKQKDKVDLSLLRKSVGSEFDSLKDKVLANHGF